MSRKATINAPEHRMTRQEAQAIMAENDGDIPDEIMYKMGNVPVSIAALYLHTTHSTLRRALIEGCPVGMAVSPGEGKREYSYIIPAHRLVKYKHGEMLGVDLTSVYDHIEDAVRAGFARGRNYL